MEKGRISQVIGPVVDVAFTGDYLPQIKEALKINNNGREEVMEVAKHLGNHLVRCIMMDAAEGLCRDMEVVATGEYIKVPVGTATLGRMFNVLGQTIDGGEPIRRRRALGYTQRGTPLREQSPIVEVLETGIKVIDLLCPYAKGGKIGLFGGAGVGKTVLIQELINSVATPARRLFYFHRSRRENKRRQRPVERYE